jgi:thiamine transport system substrate-binding protein
VIPLFRHRLSIWLASVVLAGLAASCTSSKADVPASGGVSGNAVGGRTVRLVAYDSFTPPPEVLATFTKDTGISIEVLLKGDTGTMLNTSILAKDEPFADVIWGIDSTFLSRAVSSGVLRPHSLKELPIDSALLPPVGADIVVPVDTSQVCVNRDSATIQDYVALGFASLVDPAYKGQLVVQNPASSAPGLAFLLATIAKFGENGWQDYWTQLRENDVRVVNGWEEAYNTEFSGAGVGKRGLVVSYSNSPVGAVLFGADPAATSTPISVVKETCIDVTEYAGLLANSANPDAAAVLNFLISENFQKELATNLFVYPARTGIALPEIYTRLGIAPVATPLKVDPARVQVMRDQWIDEWTEIVLG